MDFEGDPTRNLMSLVHQALRRDDIDKGALCAAAIRVIDKPPRDETLRRLDTLHAEYAKLS